ncbi:MULTISPECIES: LacI family DNA-binding transcriptional regulator [unclassified Halomonas]|uniref:LacI family DNA-binding transcriptional regulator n=1 Tax=unclassified Halomonas TaxID=2609666 RepID=UPI0006981B7A|nr:MULTISPECIES: substrate-binding domain-containing protein [unclassified Halomonas]
MPAPTLKDLARELGLSVTTVSRALGGFDDVSAATRQRVEVHARNVGYRPNHSARRLKTGTGSTVGFIMNSAYGDFRDQFNTRLLLALGQALHDRAPQHDLVVTPVPAGHDELATYRRFIEGGRVDAFVLARTLHQDPRVDYLLDTGVPFITHGRTTRSDEHAWVDVDAEAGFDEACRYLIELGHRRIELLNFESRLTTAVQRERGYLSAMADHGLSPQVTHCPHGPQSAYRHAHEVLATTHRPSALLCASDTFAYAVLQAATELGLRPGKDLDVIGADALPPPTGNFPRLTTLDVDFEAISHALIDGLLADPTEPPFQRHFRYHLRQGDTTGVA